MDHTMNEHDADNFPRMELKHRLKLAREYAGFKTPKAFADAAGVSNTTYHQYESGRSKSSRSDDALKKLAKTANVNFEWLKYGEGMPTDDSPESLEILFDAANSEAQLASNYREHDKKLLKMIFKSLKGKSKHYGLNEDDEVDIAFIAFDQIKDTNLTKAAQYKIVNATVELALQIHNRSLQAGTA